MNFPVQVIFLTVAVGVLGFFIIRPIYFRQSVLSLLRNEVTGPKLIKICEAISAINGVCPQHTFEVQRAGTIVFRGQPITLIWGYIDSVTVAGPRSSGSARFPALFALADAEQVNWMNTNPEIFTPLFVGSPFSLFGVKLSALRANNTLNPSHTGS